MNALVPLVLALCVGCSSACKVINVVNEKQASRDGNLIDNGVFKEGYHPTKLGEGSLYIELHPFRDNYQKLGNIYVKIFYEKSPTAQLEFLDYVEVQWEGNPSVQEVYNCIEPAANDDISVTVLFHKKTENSKRRYTLYKGKYEGGPSIKLVDINLNNS